MWFADARAPLRLLEHTLAIWRALPESDLGVEGSCVEAGYVLGLRLQLDGWSPALVSCTWQGWPHLHVRVEGWGLDPTAEQFGDGGPLVVQIGSVDDDYVAERGVAVDEAEVISELGFRLARLLPSREGDGWRSDAIEPLLAAVGLTRLLPAVTAAARACAANLRERSAEGQAS
jgi:hypothetical protein